MKFSLSKTLLLLTPRQYLALAILGVLFLFGQNMSGLKTISEVEQASLDIKPSLEFKPGNFEAKLTNSKPVYTFDEITLEEGKSYRLRFEVGAMVGDISEGSFGVDRSIELKAGSLVIGARDGKRSEVPLAEVAINKAGINYQQQEILFEATRTDDSIGFTRKSDSTELTLYLRSFKLESVDPLVFGKEAIKDIPSTQLAQVDTSQVETSVVSSDMQEHFTFLRKNQFIGQKIKATSDYLSGVELGLVVHGRGGNGMYRLEVWDAEDGTTPQGKILARLEFSVGELKNYRQLGLQNDFAGDRYLLPIGVFLKPGHHYLIGLSNEGVEFNLINTISVLGTNNTQEVKQAVAGVKGGALETIGGIYMRLYGARYSEIAGKRLMAGSTVTPLTASTWEYAYENRAWFTDLLDLDPVSTLKEMDKGPVFFDTRLSAVVSAVQEDGKHAVLYYTVPMLHTIQDLDLVARSVTDSQPLKLSYSWDGQHWQTVGNDSKDRSNFNLKLTPNLRTDTLYLKLEAAHFNRQMAPMIGLHSLSIKARLQS